MLPVKVFMNLKKNLFQEKDLIWKVRHFCCTFLPRLLPRIIDCVDYSNPQQVQQLHYILAKWPPLPVECAFQLLDYAYPDTFVRAFAVKCLRKHATDNDVLLYMLQLCQGKLRNNGSVLYVPLNR